MRPDIVVATPARMIDHIWNSQSFGLEEIEILVLDEADRMLDMGFQEQVFEIVKKCPPGRQTMLFSATMSEQVDALIKLSLKNPVRIRVNQNLEVAKRTSWRIFFFINPNRHLQVAKNLTEEFVRVRSGKEGDREAMVTALCARSFTRGVLVFFDHKAQAHRMKIIFGLLGLQA